MACVRRSFNRFRRIAEKIKRRYRRPRWSGPVTFDEFVRYVLDPAAQEHPVDRHWRSFRQLCQPCSKHYDFVGHYETLDADVDYVLRKLGLHNKTWFESPDPRRRRNSSNFIKPYFDKLPSNRTQQLYRQFRVDFELFGYKWPL